MANVWCEFVCVVGGGYGNGLSGFPSVSEGSDRFIKFLPGIE